jgi:pimeloyl-ACP methyl ester carboxylesterase
VSTLHVREVGRGSPLLFLLHGLGVNAAVWDPLIELLALRWPGRILAPDLRGHGRSPHERAYGFGQHAADVAALAGPGDTVYIAGHSMGGAVGLVLATGWYGIDVAGVLAFGVKVSWSDDELAKMRAFGQSPVRWFDTRAEAVERFLRVAGLNGNAGPESPVVAAGIVEEAGRFRLAADPATVLAGPLDLAILPLLRSRIVLACGSNDPLVKIDELRRYAPGALELAGRGHSVHVEEPSLIRDLIASLGGSGPL